MRKPQGFSLVELMVSLALGLFIVAVAATLLAGQLGENRRLMGEVRLMQDLRTAADLVSRDLRRAGYWGRASAGVWQPGTPAPAANPYATANPVGAGTVSLRYSRDAVENDAVDTNEQFGYRLRAGAIELQLGLGNWQALTDPSVMTVTALVFTSTTTDTPLGDSCAAACPAGSIDCPPRHRMQGIAFTATARSTTDPRVVRSLRSEVRLRNDAVLGTCPPA